jgi:hypothetical protein
MVGVGTVREDRPADLASGLLALVAVVIGVYACAVVMMASGPAAAAWAAVFVATSWAAARALVRLLAASGTGARARGHFVALSREDSKRIARTAASAFGDSLRGDDCDTDAAFGSYDEVLVSLLGSSSLRNRPLPRTGTEPDFYPMIRFARWPLRWRRTRPRSRWRTGLPLERSRTTCRPRCAPGGGRTARRARRKRPDPASPWTVPPDAVAEGQ